MASEVDMEGASQWRILLDTAIAMALGGLIGIEREIANRPAGFRTHMLVAGAAALLVGLGDALMMRFIEGPGALPRTDPIRVVEAIVTGVSFLGAGTIFRRVRGEQVEGLTTAASLLLTAAIGIATALRQWVLALGVVAITLVVLRGLRTLEARLNAPSRSS
jgi:putative Mg2+ transporter-C (MgtC) family protein